jgi:putative GTP pyrophosphokinase
VSLIIRDGGESEAPEVSLELLKQYHESAPLYEKLADEVAFSLEKRLREEKIPFAHVVKRLKTFSSVTEKVSRKQYQDPLRELKDIAGVRVVFLYPSTRSLIEGVIEKEFKVVETSDKASDLQEDQFGYNALHYVVRLGEKTSGARYEDLKHLVCEIQVRTVMQDAWAIIDHHLVYKNEASVPSKFKRHLSEISGMFENIDRQFDGLRREREAYVKEVAKELPKEAKFLEQELNFETMSAYLKQRLPDMPASDVTIVSNLVGKLSDCGVRKLAEVDRMMKQTEKAREQLRIAYPPLQGVTEVVRAAGLSLPAYLGQIRNPHLLRRYKSVMHLVERD